MSFKRKSTLALKIYSTFYCSDMTPRWVILLADGLISYLSFAVSLVLVSQTQLVEAFTIRETIMICIFYGVTATLMFRLLHLHRGLIRYSNLHDTSKVFGSVLATSLVFLFISFMLLDNGWSGRTHSSRSMEVLAKSLFLNFFINSTLLILFRAAIKSSYYFLKKITTSNRKNVIIYGTDKNAMFIKKALDAMEDFRVIGFLVMSRTPTYAHIEQVPVYNLNQLEKLRVKKSMDNLVLMNEQLGSAEKQNIIKTCLSLNIHVLTAPPTHQWLYGKIDPSQLKQLKIEDLLQREAIQIDDSRISEDLAGKRVLITGAAGSIGSEIVRQVLSFKPAVVILVDQAESPLHDVQLEMEEEYPNIKKIIYICGIQNKQRMEAIFRDYSPQIVYHAAAYKHVPMMEQHPQEAVFTNILGTKVMADLAIAYGTEKFVMISTDKAVNPTNVMGASKRIAEMYVQSRNSPLDSFIQDGELFVKTGGIRPGKTKFITTRFGNVLDSNGSVIPRFRQQISKGGPITVTHPDITRFFMTIKEAVQLVLEAGTMGKGGEIYVFDMGSPVKIRELAKTMIRLANLEPDKDIKIVYTGLRPGEKLYEEVLNENEKTLPTHHSKIRIAKVITRNAARVSDEIDELHRIAIHANPFKVVKKMKELVPEYKSNNSRYEILDNTIVSELQKIELS